MDPRQLAIKPHIQCYLFLALMITDFRFITITKCDFGAFI